jgi:DNA-binding Lrp family transcriptional regulator
MPVPGSGTPRQAVIAARRERALALAQAGLSLRAIGRQLGVSAPQVLRDLRALLAATTARTALAVEEYRRLELARLDALHAAYWEAAVSGTDREAAKIILAVMKQRAELLGLAVPPAGATAAATAPVTIEVAWTPPPDPTPALAGPPAAAAAEGDRG